MPAKVDVRPSGVEIIIFTRPSSTPSQLSTASPLRQIKAPLEAQDSSDSAATRASCSLVNRVPQRVACNASCRDSVGMGTLFAGAAFTREEVSPDCHSDDSAKAGEAGSVRDALRGPGEIRGGKHAAACTP
jgi:hypothetical protein